MQARPASALSASMLSHQEEGLSKGARSATTSEGRDLSWTKDWMESYVRHGAQLQGKASGAAGTGFKNLIKHCEERILEVEAATRSTASRPPGQRQGGRGHAGDGQGPNPLLTAVCCSVLEDIAPTLGPHKGLVSRIRSCLVDSIYGAGSSRPGTDLMEKEPFFAQIASWKIRSEVLEGRCVELEREVERLRGEAKGVQDSIERVREEREGKVQAEQSKVAHLEVAVENLEVEVRKGLRVAEQLEAKVEAGNRAVEAERASVDGIREGFERRMTIAQGILGRQVPKEELMLVRARIRELEAEVEGLKEELSTERGELTPRPSWFRASEVMGDTLKKDGAGGRPLSSREIADALCDKAHAASVRYERIESRLSRSFVRIAHSQVDRFAFEGKAVDECLQCIYISYSSPSETPSWREKSSRLIALSRSRLSETKYRTFLKDASITPRLDSKQVLNAFTDAGSGRPVVDISYAEFRVCLAMLAVMLHGDKHHTHEDMRAVISKFSLTLMGEDKEEFLDKLEAREVARAEEIRKNTKCWKQSLKQ